MKSEFGRRRRASRVWNDDLDARLKHLWTIHGGGIARIAKAMGRSNGSISGRSRVLGLQFHGGRARVLEPFHQAALQGISVFHGKVAKPFANVLQPGDSQRKLGGWVTKGDWRGLPIYSLTLEERATCPHDCKQWLSCYGNNMGLAKRFEHGEKLMTQLFRELHILQATKGAFVVRLHILGDFFSPGYVDFWETCLDFFPGLYVFGYTAWQRSTPIGDAIISLRQRQPKRFKVRTSGAVAGPRTVVIECPPDAEMYPDPPIICPVQTGKTKNCGSCGLCWSHAAWHRPIAFLQH